MGKPYKSDGKWFRNGIAMSQLDIDLMNSKEPVVKTKGLGLNSETMKPKLNEIKKPIQKKPRPPGKLTESEKLIKDLIARKKRFSGGGTKMLFGD